MHECRLTYLGGTSIQTILHQLFDGRGQVYDDLRCRQLLHCARIDVANHSWRMQARREGPSPKHTTYYVVWHYRLKNMV